MKRKYILILAATYPEGTRYARRKGLHSGQYRIVLQKKSLAGIRVAEAHVLPGFKTAPQRHGIYAALRWAKGVTLVDIEERESQEKAVRASLAELDGTDETAARFIEEHGVVVGALDAPVATLQETAEMFSARIEQMLSEEETDGEEARAEEPGEDAAQDEEPVVRRRRSRCAKCSTLHFPEDDCPKSDPALDGFFFGGS